MVCGKVDPKKKVEISQLQFAAGTREEQIKQSFFIQLNKLRGLRLIELPNAALNVSQQIVQLM